MEGEKVKAAIRALPYLWTGHVTFFIYSLTYLIKLVIIDNELFHYLWEESGWVWRSIASYHYHETRIMSFVFGGCVYLLLAGATLAYNYQLMKESETHKVFYQHILTYELLVSLIVIVALCSSVIAPLVIGTVIASCLVVGLSYLIWL